MKLDFFKIIKILPLVIVASFFAAVCGCSNVELKTPKVSARVNNTVILVGFKGEGGFSNEFVEKLQYDLNESETGVKAFFYAESLGKCTVDSFIAGEVTVSRDSGYYKKYSRFENPNGYSVSEIGGKPRVDYFYREQMLIREALNGITFSEDYQADGDGDGFADGITFVFNCEFVGRNSSEQKITWPHQSCFYGSEVIESNFYVPDGFFESEGVSPKEAFAIPEINGVKVADYNIVSVDMSTVGDMCHELSHLLGLPDYYSYTGGFTYDNIGKYDILGASVGDIPQYSLAFVRSKLGWLNEGKEIAVYDDSFELSLLPVTRAEDGDISALKLIPADFKEKGEFFMIETREKVDGRFDCTVNSSGVLIYRVNEIYAYYDSSGNIGHSDYGNMYGNGKFEITLLQNGLLNYFSGKNGGTALDDLKFSDGTSAGIRVEILAENGGSYGISVNYSKKCEYVQTEPEIVSAAGSGVINVTWSPKVGGGKTVFAVIEADGRSSAAYQANLLPSAVKVINENGAGYKLLSWAVKDSSSQLYIPKITGECYVLTATVSEGNEIYAQKVFYVKEQGSSSPNFTFSDFVAVAFMPWNPAFIVCFGILIICVITGFLVVIIRKIKKR